MGVSKRTPVDVNSLIDNSSEGEVDVMSLIDGDEK